MPGGRQRGRFVAFRNDRLGGRLNAILTAMRLARAYGTTFRVFWALSEESSPELHHPEELFSRRFVERHFTTREEGRELLAGATDIGMVPRGTTREAFLASLEAGASYLSNAATEQLLLPWEGPEDLAGLPELLRGVPFSRPVGDAMRRIDRALRGMAFSSYHLRRGDIVDDATTASHNLWSDKYVPRVVYEWHIRRELARGEGRILVFSDARAEAAAFAALSPRVSSFDDLVGGLALTPIQRDFLELHTMSRSQAIFAPPSSAFSRLAAVIGNREVTDVEADLPPPDREAALDELVERLDRRAGAFPEAFLSQSDAGQNLPFIAAHLDARGEGARATAIALRLVEGGMDRAYAYPFLSERLLAADDLDGCDRLVATLGARPCHREEHWSQVFLHGALADMAREGWDRALRRFQSGAWFFPINSLAAQTFWYLAAVGRLPPEAGLPFDPHLMRRARQIYDPEASPTHRLLTRRLADAGLAPLVYPSNMEVRDWRLLSGKKLSFRFSNRAKIRQQAGLLADNLSKPRNAPERVAALRSAVGALLSDAGEHAEARRHLEAALAARPDEPLYLKRLADHLRATGRPGEGMKALERAWELSGRRPAFQAELALARHERRDQAGYRELMLGLAGIEAPPVELRFLVIEALRRGEPHRAQSGPHPEPHPGPHPGPRLDPRIWAHLAALEAAAPGAHRVISLRAKLHEQAGQWGEALAALKALERLGRSEAIVRAKMARLLEGYRESHDERAARRWFRAEGLAHLL